MAKIRLTQDQIKEIKQWQNTSTKEQVTIRQLSKHYKVGRSAIRKGLGLSRGESTIRSKESVLEPQVIDDKLGLTIEPYTTDVKI